MTHKVPLILTLINSLPQLHEKFFVHCMSCKLYKVIAVKILLDQFCVRNPHHHHASIFRVKVSYNKPTRCTTFSNLFLEWNSTCFGQFLCPSSGVFCCTDSNGICHTSLLTACEQDQDGTQFHPVPARKLLANLYDIYHCCVYNERLLMMDKGTIQNM